MKPLEPDVHKTGKWNFSGKNLPPAEVEALTAKGVDWDEDIMPDGRLKHPRLRLRRQIAMNKLRKGITEGIHAGADDLSIRYRALPDPKPNYLEWASQQVYTDLFRELYAIAMNGASEQQRIKAVSVLLEFTKARPKQQLEVSTPANLEPVDPDKLLEIALELKQRKLTEVASTN